MVERDKYDVKMLPANSFVRPIDIKYVPQHCLDRFPGFDSKYQVFVYCRYGIVPIPKNQIRET